MNFKTNKGYVGVDASLGVLVLLIIVPTLVGMIYNVNKTNNFIDRKTEAISIAVNTLETAKALGPTELTAENINTKLEQIYSDEFSSTDSVLTKNEVAYKIEIEIIDYANTTNGVNNKASINKVKLVKTTVTFKTGNKEKSIDLSTVVS